MMWYYGYGLNWFAMALMVVGTILFILLLVVLAWAIIRWLEGRLTSAPRASSTRESPSALEILRQRYARGEIDSETFERMSAQIESTGMPYQQQKVPFSSR